MALHQSRRWHAGRILLLLRHCDASKNRRQRLVHPDRWLDKHTSIFLDVSSWISAAVIPPGWTTRFRTALTRRGCTPDACLPKQSLTNAQLRQSACFARYTSRSVPSASVRRSCGRRILSAGQRSVPSSWTVKASPVNRPLARPQFCASSSGLYCANMGAVAGSSHVGTAWAGWPLPSV